MNGKEMPHDLTAEKSVLGAMFLSKYALQRAVETLSGEQFYSDENSKISFRCKTTFEKMDKFLLEIESKEKQEESLDIDEFLEELRTICGNSQAIELFALYMNSFADFFSRKNIQEENLSEEDTPPKF